MAVDSRCSCCCSPPAMTGRAVVLILASGLKGVYDDVCFLVYGKKTII